MSNSIGWCDTTLNPVVGCSPVSAGCDHCFAARQARRFCKFGEQFDGLVDVNFIHGKCYPKHKFNGQIRFYPERLQQPFKWRKPRRIFLDSMGDLFHPGVANEHIAAVFGMVAACPQHQFLILTKRIERAVEWFQHMARQDNCSPDVVNCRGDVLEAGYQLLHIAEPEADGPIHCKHGPNLEASWHPPNLWLGTSVEDQHTANERITLLLQCPAAHYFISWEPALGELRFTSNNTLGMPIRCCYGHECGCMGKPIEPPPYLDLVICGAETGPKRRPMNLDWARSVRDQCAEAGVPFWFKQDSDGNKTLDGVEHHPEFWK